MGTPNITRRFLSMLPTTSISEQQPAPDATAVLNLDFAKPFVPQVQSYLEALGNSARGNTRVALVGQGVAAILMLPALEMLGGLPQVALVPFGSKSVADWVSTADFRQAISIHGISEDWPRTIRLNKGSDNEFHVEEIVDVQSMRQWAVGLAAKLESEKPIVALSGNIPEGFRAALELLANEHGVTIRG